VFHLHPKTAWGDYFPAPSPTPYNSIFYSSRQTPSDSSVCVSNCLFSSISSSDYGGALYSASATYFLVELSSFFSIKSSAQHGGAIYFKNTDNGQSVLHGVCSYDCLSTYTSTNRGQFAYMYVNDAVSSKNYVNYSSIVRSVNANSNSWFTLYLYSGNNCCPSVNISLNGCYGDIIYCYPSVDSNYATCSFSYSSIIDNIVPGYTCFLLWRPGAKYEIKCCNILRNKQGPHTQGTIATRGILVIKESCILENNATYVFYQSSSSYTITISNYTVDRTSNNGYLTIQNPATKSFIHALNHISTKNCDSKYDSAGILTPIIQTPSSSKKQRQCSCEKFFYQCPQGNFFLSVFVLIFSFIHLY
jgi:hypothetical protein